MMRPLRTTVIGSYPFPAWLEFASAHLDQFGKDDIEELIDDATRIAIADTAGGSRSPCLKLPSGFCFDLRYAVALSTICFPVSCADWAWTIETANNIANTIARPEVFIVSPS